MIMDTKRKSVRTVLFQAFSSAFVKDILDNPVYMGKIAYGRRRTERSLEQEMRCTWSNRMSFHLRGQHEAIISEEDWHLAQEKRKVNAFRREKVTDPEHAHILSGILKCPCCGKSLYGNIAKAHSKRQENPILLLLQKHVGSNWSQMHLPREH